MYKNSSSSFPPFVNLAGFTRVIEGKRGYVLRKATMGKWWELDKSWPKAEFSSHFADLAPVYVNWLISVQEET